MIEKPQTEIKTDDTIINHLRNVKLLQAIHSGKNFFVECDPTDEGARKFPNSNFAVKEIELPNFDLFEEKKGFAWMNVRNDNTKDLLADIISWEKDLSEYDSLESILRERYVILKRSNPKQ
jgi:hypothetical protein